MARPVPAIRSVYVCQQCGASAPRWSGQCGQCEAWNTLVETVVTRPAVGAGAGSRARERAAVAGSAAISPIGEVSSAEASRLASGIGELDRVLGGGLVPGSIVLFGGDPGIGKSTLLLQLAGRLASAGHAVLYLTGEESAAQVRGRAERVGAVVTGVGLVATTDLAWCRARSSCSAGTRGSARARSCYSWPGAWRAPGTPSCT